MYAPSSVHCIMQELSCFQPAHRQIQTNDVIENVAGISSAMNAWILLSVDAATAAGLCLTVMCVRAVNGEIINRVNN